MKDWAFKESVSRWCLTSNKAHKLLGVDNLNEPQLCRLQDVLENEITVIDTSYVALMETHDKNLDQTIVKRYEDVERDNYELMKLIGLTLPLCLNVYKRDRTLVRSSNKTLP